MAAVLLAAVGGYVYARHESHWNASDAAAITAYVGALTRAGCAVDQTPTSPSMHEATGRRSISALARAYAKCQHAQGDINAASDTDARASANAEFDGAFADWNSAQEVAAADAQTLAGKRSAAYSTALLSALAVGAILGAALLLLPSRRRRVVAPV